MTPLYDAIDRYIDRCRRRSMALATIHNYAAALRRFALHASKHGHTLLQTIDRRLVESYLDGLADANQTKRTMAHRLQVLRQFIAWSNVERLLDRDPTQGIKLRWHAKRVTAPEMAALITMVERIPAAANGPLGWLDVRDRAALMLTLETALRVSEIACLDIPDPLRNPPLTVDLHRLEAVVKAKGGAVDVVNFSTTTARALEAWLGERAKIDTGASAALFLSTRRLRMTRAALHQMVKRRGEASGIAGLHYHLLRHRRIGDVIERLGVQSGQVLARHKHASTTVNVYGHQTQRVVRERIQNEAALGWGRVAA